MKISTAFRAVALGLALVVGGPILLAQSTSAVLEPANCKLFTASTAGADHNSDDVGVTTYSKPIDIGKFNKLSVAVKWASLTGSIDAVVKLQVATAPYPASADWNDKASATFTVSGATSLNSISVVNLTERWARVVYSHNSVTGGSITGYCYAKSI